MSKLEIENFSLVVNGIIPREGTQNPLFTARAKMQAHYLTQIESDFSYAKQRMTLLAGEIRGVGRLREGKIFFDGEPAVGADEARIDENREIHAKFRTDFLNRVE